tara:strand:- start:587 stop:748 length:162 start_codon:yes stop_codon:yes gene_type:complete
MSKSFCVIHKESGKECIVEVDKYDNANIKKEFTKRTGIEISPTEIGLVEISPC